MSVGGKQTTLNNVENKLNIEINIESCNFEPN